MDVTGLSEAMGILSRSEFGDFGEKFGRDRMLSLQLDPVTAKEETDARSEPGMTGKMEPGMRNTIGAKGRSVSGWNDLRAEGGTRTSWSPVS